MMNPTETTQLMERDLAAHLNLCTELLDLATRENSLLRNASGDAAAALRQNEAARKSLLPRLDCSLISLRTHRITWRQLSAAQRALHPQVPALIRTIQESSMKVIVLDRENEQALLRRGLVPARHLPRAERQQPHFVANLYQRQAAPGAAMRSNTTL